MTNGKRYLLLITFTIATLLAFGQTKKTYTREWKKIDSLLEKSGLYKTALKETEKIYSAAKKEKNDVQIIKALIYKMGINDHWNEPDKNDNLALLESEIAGAKEPARSILHSIAGVGYWRYLQRNRWRFYNRTPGNVFDKDDIATWDLQQLHDRIAFHFEASLTNKKLLAATRVSSIEPLVIKGNSRSLRPVLFDLLAHRALEYYGNDERYINKPAYAFEIRDSMAFADAASFSRHTFQTSDSASLHYKALTLFQNLIAFHLNDPKPDALIDADIHRLQFADNFGTHPRRRELYKDALAKLVNRYPDATQTADAMYLLAQWYMAQGNNYDPAGDTSNRYALVEAKKWCEKAIRTKNVTEGKSNAVNLLQQILSREIQLNTEKVNLPGEPFRVLVNYRNTAHAYFRLAKIDQQLKRAFANDSWNDSLWKVLTALPAIRAQDVALPDTKDHQLHRAEIKIDALPIGEYALISSAQKEFPFNAGALSVSFFYVSSLSYVNDRYKYYVLNRGTGVPVSDANVQAWKETYNYQTKKNVLQRAEKYTTDKTGYFELKHQRMNERSNYRLEISYKGDRFFSDDYAENYVYSDYLVESAEDKTFLFSDRSIYRPGQLVYFKGIVIRSDGSKKDPEILPARKSLIQLIDANGEVADSLTLTTNDFGSYSGKFTLPTNLLNGQFRLRDVASNSVLYFQVEEYKRPKFFVEIKKPGNTYRLNDSVTVEGTATSYAGNNVNGATVAYRVVRRANFPLWTRGYHSRIWPPYPAEQMEITHGVTVTDDDGKFVIPFTAIPDNKIPEDQQPLFHYEITADVTDINGETRSGNASITVGYNSLLLDIHITESIKADSLNKISISSRNLNDSFVQTPVKLSVYKLAAPERIFRDRYWEEPDQFVMSREEYYRNFPHDMYSDELDQSKWKDEKMMLETSVTAAKETVVPVPGKSFPSGWYLFEATGKDRFDKTVMAKKYVLVVNDQLITPIAGAMFDLSRHRAEPGDKVSYALMSNLDSLHIIHELVRSDDTLRNMQDRSLKNELTVSADDKNNINVNAVFVKNNRVYSNQTTIDVQRTDKMLKIDYSTFRNKTLPGTHETWKVKIGGMKGENVSAELLTAMYDASLDQFNPHSWQTPRLFDGGYYTNSWTGKDNFLAVESIEKYEEVPTANVYVKNYDRLKTFDDIGIAKALSGKMYGVRVMDAAAPEAADQAVVSRAATEKKEVAVQYDTVVKSDAEKLPSVQPRKNLNETAFFLPALYTDTSGNIEFSFTTPEALTTWKWLLLAHTKDLALGSGEKTMITQKELMVQPNMPRFLREGDQVALTSKIVNMSSSALSGEAVLTLIDPLTNKSTNQEFLNTNNRQKFTVKPGESVPVKFLIKIPSAYTQPVTWNITATANNSTYSDGEEAMLPVLSNRMLITESIPLPVRNTRSKNFRFEKLLNSGSSNTLVQNGVTVEFTSNPAWYAVQALPYLAEIKSENAEQVFNRFYANAIASHIANSSPRLKSIIEEWKNSDTSAFLSNLQKNEELKSVILQETPWVLEAKSESQQKKNVALLFDMVNMSSEFKSALLKLQDMQAPTGGFVWYKGGREDRYMTQHIVAGIGHLKKLSALPESSEQTIQQIVSKAVSFLDQQIKNDHRQLPKNKTGFVPPIPNIPVHYLYARSFFDNIKVPADVSAAYQHYRNLSKKEWTKNSTYLKGMIALSLYRTADKQTAENIVASLKESSITHEEMGMYWKDMTAGYYWYQAPVETQSLLIETFAEITGDTAAVADMKTWLLKNKQTNSWHTSKSTADACYALLLQGANWLSAEPQVTISLGEKKVTPLRSQAGTGYFKSFIAADSVSPAMGNISVSITPTDIPAWGAVYWQYFENLDKITTAKGPLSIKKQLFVLRNSDRGPVLQPIGDNNTVKVGDKIKVRIEIRADRMLEYVHMKDMRASSFEPVNVISSYKWQGGLGYYESTKDASTNFYFSSLPRGVHIFEYELFVTHAGTFSNGITSIQCMYAPEFGSHTEGINVNAVP